MQKQELFYSLYYTTSPEAQLLMLFLTDSYNGKYTREWINDTESEGLAKNIIDIERKGEKFAFSDSLFDQYDTKNKKLEFTITKATFLKILDQWEQTLKEDKAFIVIEVTRENDVNIYALDKLTEQDQQLYTLFWEDKNIT